MLYEKLLKREIPIKIGNVGIGSVGQGIMYQASITQGIECPAIADIDLQKAINAAERFKFPYRIVENQTEMDEAVEAGKLAICEDASLVAKCPHLDVLFDCSSAVGETSNFDPVAIENGKHLIMMNTEADLMYGPYYDKLARENGLIYTSSDGDQPAIIKKLIDEITFWGFEPVMGGNIKGYMDMYTNPELIIPEADKRGLDYEMCTSYTDGTKLCVEMAIVANALNYGIARPGMIGPRMETIREIEGHFDFESIHREHGPVVDYILGARPKGGVFCIGYTEKPFQQETLAWLPSEMGKGPYYYFYRPYHLTHFESMVCVAETVINKRSMLRPEYGLKTNVYTYAKTDLQAGDIIDGFGGFKTYGLIEKC